jgi:hypothetical protein
MGDILFDQVTSNKFKHNLSVYFVGFLNRRQQSSIKLDVAFSTCGTCPPSTPLTKSLVPMIRAPNGQKNAELNHLLYTVSAKTKRQEVFSTF